MPLASVEDGPVRNEGECSVGTLRCSSAGWSELGIWNGIEDSLYHLARERGPVFPSLTTSLHHRQPLPC